MLVSPFPSAFFRGVGFRLLRRSWFALCVQRVPPAVLPVFGARRGARGCAVGWGVRGRWWLLVRRVGGCVGLPRRSVFVLIFLTVAYLPVLKKVLLSFLLRYCFFRMFELGLAPN